MQEWGAEEHLAFMEKNNISKSILSCSSPGTHLIPGNDGFGRKVTREVNEYAADLKRKHPSNALLEIDYALDNLNADGFVMMYNYHGLYLGDPTFAPVYAKLQARRATVFVHPTAPCIARVQPQRQKNETDEICVASAAIVPPPDTVITFVKFSKY